MPRSQESTLKRLRRIEGQVRGLQKMIDEDRNSVEVLTQISSVQEALRAVGRVVMRDHLRRQAERANRSGAEERAEAIYEELVTLMYTHAR